MNEIDSVLRTENKYLMTELERGKLQQYFSQILREDLNNGMSGYTVRSLYFDTPDFKDYYDKIDGLEDRRKLRLRIYGSDDETVKLELKEKFGTYQCKRSLTISKSDAESIAGGNISPLKNSEIPFAQELYLLMSENAYIASCVVEYQRFAYVQPENNIRITFDTDVRACMSPFDFFNKELVCCPVLPLGQSLMEVKYDNFLLSYIKDAINACDYMTTAVSKYCMARIAGDFN